MKATVKHFMCMMSCDALIALHGYDEIFFLQQFGQEKSTTK
jgi:hypothetical protein